MTQPPVLELVGIEKSFPGVRALRGVDLDVRPGEIHCLVGENGAGKSTLIKILAGVYQADAGEVRVLGTLRQFARPVEAQEAGLSFVFQELNVVEHLSVGDNMSLGLEGSRFRWDRREATRLAAKHLGELGVDIDPAVPMQRLRPAERQLVMIAKALSTSARAIVMDEPTAALTETEIERLFEIVRRLRSSGVAVLYVSHRLEEVFALADRITVMRDGQRVATQPAEELDRSKVVALMVGRALDSIYEHPVRTPGEEALRLEGVGGARGRVTSVDLVVHAGEVVGLSGIVGSGRTELARIVFGAEPLESGEMFLWGRAVPSCHAQRRRSGVASASSPRSAGRRASSACSRSGRTSRWRRRAV